MLWGMALDLPLPSSLLTVSRWLVVGVVTLAENAKMREQLGQNGRRYAESHLDKILTEFESRLQELVKAGA